MAVTSQTFPNITPEKFAAIEAAVKAKTGVDIGTSPAGTATKDGVTMQWAYDEASQTLVVSCLSNHWFFISKDKIESSVNDLVENAA